MQACKQCQAVNATELQPPQLRQKTTTAVARRLIGNALNVAGVHDKVIVAVLEVKQVFLECHADTAKLLQSRNGKQCSLNFNTCMLWAEFMLVD